ncbi:MAG: acyl carrier protein [Oscillospiraceae bacterium]|jgi:acyl carrier protein|nr:acyl carrier protein [Oscillospiraceae bacterium]MBQ5522243.1 acyl carrier protein [Oscillospiraceae bacterium]
MFDKVTEILDGYTEVRKEEMTPDMLLVDDLGLNSVSYFAIVFDLEDAFDIEIPDDAVKTIKTIRDLVEFIESEL